MILETTRHNNSAILKITALVKPLTLTYKQIVHCHVQIYMFTGIPINNSEPTYLFDRNIST